MYKKQSTEPYLESVQTGAVTKTITIQPCCGKAVEAGTYNVSVRNPKVVVQCQPEMDDDMGISYERLDIPGEQKYILLYQFQNFSQKTCRVTMYFNRGVADGRI